MRYTLTHKVVTLALAGLMALPGIPQAAAQGSAQPPHAWLFGAWTGGMFPAPVTLTAQECQAQPVVIFTRDVVLRATLTDTAYTQRLVETVRATGSGAEFRLVNNGQSAAAGGGLLGMPAGGASLVGFGCDSPDVLHVQRRTENEISFPGCADFPYPLVRCPAR